MNRYVVIATPDELPLIERFPEYLSCPVIVTGTGAMNVIQALRDIPRDSAIVNIGYAGSVDIPVGSVVKVGVVTTYHPIAPVFETSLALDFGSGNIHCYTSTDFVTQAKEKGCVYDMELAFIASLGFRSLKAIKVVSDHCDMTEYVETIRKNETNGKN